MKLLDTLKALSMAQKLALAGALAGVVIAMTMLMQGAVKQPMGLLYAGLDPMHTGEVIAELEKRGVDYEIRGEAIFVPNSERDSVRFSLAKDGLPQQSVRGYELLDDVNGFSVTSEMYNATYWRAKEGELTRTILAIPGVASARVHIGASLRSGFSRSGPSQTASVTLVASNRISASQAEAIQYLVALAVSGLEPADAEVTMSPSTEAEIDALVERAKTMVATRNVVQAIDAATGEMIWEFAYSFPPDAPKYGGPTRNIAIYGDKLFMSAYDTAIVAIDARTGTLVWRTVKTDYTKGYSHTSGGEAAGDCFEKLWWSGR